MRHFSFCNKKLECPVVEVLLNIQTEYSRHLVPLLTEKQNNCCRSGTMSCIIYLQFFHRMNKCCAQGIKHKNKLKLNNLAACSLILAKFQSYVDSWTIFSSYLTLSVCWYFQVTAVSKCCERKRLSN